MCHHFPAIVSSYTTSTWFYETKSGGKAENMFSSLKKIFQDFHFRFVANRILNEHTGNY